MTRAKTSQYRIDKSIAWLTRRRDGLLRQIRSLRPILGGSVVLIARICGNSARCACTRGKKHVSTYLTFRVAGKTRTLYIPVDLEKDVRSWSAEYKRLKDRIAQLCEVQRAIIRRHVEERRRRS
jgi:hypothetical protein